MAKIKAVLFDMDGVLIDAKDWHYKALNKALSIFGFEISRYDHLVTYDGLPTKKKLQILSAEQGFPEDLHSFINEMKQQYTLEIVYSKCKPVFTHQYALSKLKSEGYKIAVCSNSIRDSIDTMMKKSGLDKFIDFYLSNQDVKKSKPDPEIYITAMNRFGLKPEECLIVEDNENGILAAQASKGHLLKVKTVHDVNYSNIIKRIREVEAR